MRGWRGFRFVIPRGADSPHTEQLRPPNVLDVGPGPNRIDRPGLMSKGKIGPNVNAFPMTLGMEYVGHVPLVQIRKGPSLIPGNTVDDRATIPAIFAGNPVG